MKKALISGSLGQDGSHLCEYLLSLGSYEVWGGARGMVFGKQHYGVSGVHYIYLDLRDKLSIETALRKVQPDELYNFGGQVFVPTSWTSPAETFDVNTGGLARILSCIDDLKLQTKVYQASSSEMFGNAMQSVPTSLAPETLSEDSPMNPVSPYAVSKYAAHKLVDVYRQKGLFVVSGICFNHEGPRRGPEMVTRKITRAVAQWTVGNNVPLHLGNMDTARDWGYAGDYVVAMHLMLQKLVPEDFVIGTGVSHTVREFLEAAVKFGADWRHLCLSSGMQTETRANELYCLRANPYKALTKLGWTPKKNFLDLVKLMVETDITEVRAQMQYAPGATV